MGKKTLMLMLAILLQGCAFFEKTDPHGRTRAETMGGPSKAKPGTEEEQVDTSRHLYICAVEYPKGYDWVKDTAYDVVEARLMLFKDGICTVSLPTGGTSRVSTDPDTHWILDGHLLTTCSDGLRTWIRQDGEPLAEYDGGEDIKGILFRDGMLWTMGEKLRGQGLTLRCDGIVAANYSQGTPIGTLYEDDGALCFAYSIVIRSGNYVIRKYYISADGTEKEVSVPSDATAVFDIRRVHGITYATYTQESVPHNVLVSTDSGARTLKYSSNSDYTEWCSIMPAGAKGILIKARCIFRNGAVRYVVWDLDNIHTAYDYMTSIYDIYVGENGDLAALGCDNRTGETLLFGPPNGDRGISLGRKFRFITPRAATLVDGKFFAGLTGDEGNLLWAAGMQTPLDINGPVTGVAYQ